MSRTMRIATLIYMIFIVVLSGYGMMEDSPDLYYLGLIDNLWSGAGLVCLMLYVLGRRPEKHRPAFKIIAIAQIFFSVVNMTYICISNPYNATAIELPILIILATLLSLPQWILCYRYAFRPTLDAPRLVIEPSILGVDQSTVDHPSSPPAAAIETVQNSLFSRHGRLGRLSMMAAYACLYGWVMVLSMANGLVYLISTVVFNMNKGTEDTFATVLFVIMSLIVLCPWLLVFGFILLFFIRRLRDLDMSGWWIVLPLLLTMNAVVLFIKFQTQAAPLSITLSAIALLMVNYVCLAPGSKGPNNYGAPRFTPRYEQVLGWICGVFFALLNLVALLEIIDLLLQ